jgi:hypothetical protein
MKTKTLKFITLTLIIFLYQQQNIFASHIIGGEMTYKCLGNNQYEISLKIHRDCDSGVAWFDNSASIGIFDAQTNNYISAFMIPLNTASNDTVSLDYPDSCIYSICVHYTVYSQIITLPFSNTGYVLTYQRCCRSGDLLNIINPSATGMTITTEITSAGMLSCNNSPIFNREIPLIISTIDTFSTNLNATDIDGDSLVYELYAPFNGMTTSNPIPSHPSAPPYDTVLFQAPYTSSNPLGGNALFDWNTSTGELSILPSNLGTYVIGFLILEYNSAGVLLGKTYRDVIVRVSPVPCSPITSVDKITKEGSLIQLFPNPVKDNIQIEANHTEKITLRIYSIDGRQVLTNKEFQQQATINLNTLPRGVYFMEFQSNSNRIIKKVIKE